MIEVRVGYVIDRASAVYFTDQGWHLWHNLSPTSVCRWKSKWVLVSSGNFPEEQRNPSQEMIVRWSITFYLPSDSAKHAGSDGTDRKHFKRVVLSYRGGHIALVFLTQRSGDKCTNCDFLCRLLYVLLYPIMLLFFLHLLSTLCFEKSRLHPGRSWTAFGNMAALVLRWKTFKTFAAVGGTACKRFVIFIIICDY